MHLAEQRQVFGPDIDAHFQRAGIHRADGHFRLGLGTAWPFATEWCHLAPVPQGNIRAVGNESRGKKLVLDAANIPSGRPARAGWIWFPGVPSFLNASVFNLPFCL